jgi:DNA helicase-2/ATP-dependent DNA helicase PcrA
MFQPTPEQKQIIEEIKSCVVIANPGSGKTSTLACKIKNILHELPDYRGVIAISYTNKASDELKKRCLDGGLDKKGSFFGTIDKFYISEIVIPFGLHVFGQSSSEVNIYKASTDLEEYDPIWEILNKSYKDINEKDIKTLGDRFLKGKIYLESVGLLALYIFDNSFSCRRYLKTKYSHVFIDEYQDSGEEQHSLFCKLQNLGLCAVAVGDLNQSIYAFSKKDSKFLSMLATETNLFKTFPLSFNHRCHPSIIEYSTQLLSNTYQPKSVLEKRVLYKSVDGSENEIAQWLNGAIGGLIAKYQVEKQNKVGILVRGNRTGAIIHSNLKLKHKLFNVTPLDEDSSLWGGIFRRVLNVIFDQNETIYEIVEEHLNIDLQVNRAKKAIEILRELSLVAVDNPNELINHQQKIIEIAKLVFPHGENRNAINILNLILKTPDLLNSFKPASDDELQIMTLHKSKGLEFDLVFHLDLYKFIMPKYKATPSEWIQDLNLHYVGITRAKKCCVLCLSTQRHNDLGIRDAEPSDFLLMNNLPNLRDNCPV